MKTDVEGRFPVRHYFLPEPIAADDFAAAKAAIADADNDGRPARRHPPRRSHRKRDDCHLRPAAPATITHRPVDLVPLVLPRDG